jgi:preprotein translocase subunit SecD
MKNPYSPQIASSKSPLFFSFGSMSQTLLSTSLRDALIKGVLMHRLATWLACLFVMMFAGLVQAQAQFSIRAASAEPVDGWQRMQLDDRAVWVSPTATVTASDIEKAQPETTPDGRTMVAVVFTDAGAQKIRELTIAQKNKLVALVVGEKLIWAPMVRAEIGKQASLTGNSPTGLTKEEVERIMASLK